MQGILVSVPSSGDGGGDRRFLLDDGTGVVELTLSPNFLNRDWKLGDYVMFVEGCLIRDDQLPLIKLGHGDYESQSSPGKVSWFASRHVEQVACGMRHSLALLKGDSGDQIYSCGSGKRGQLGLSNEEVKSTCLPQSASGLEGVNISSISANGDHSAAMSVDGHFYTWGRGFSGTSDVFCPTCVVSPFSFAQAALGWNHALVQIPVEVWRYYLLANRPEHEMQS